MVPKRGQLRPHQEPHQRVKLRSDVLRHAGVQHVRAHPPQA